jgi:hypothetical protein
MVDSRTSSAPLGKPLVTMFALPKPFRGLAAVQQRNAIESWIRLGNDVEVLLLGDEPGIPDVANMLNVRHIPSIDKNEFGTPLLGSAFRIAEASATGQFLCYVNSDIILMPDFIRAVLRINFSRFLMCGRRWDAQIQRPIDYKDPGWVRRLKRYALRSGNLDSEYAIDYFVFTRGLWNTFPQFAVGRFAWDNWIIYSARREKIPVIDATNAVFIVHQSHGYDHVSGGLVEARNGIEGQRNRELASDMGSGLYGIDDATWRLTENRLRLKWRFRHPQVHRRMLQARRWLIEKRWGVEETMHELRNGLRRLLGQPRGVIEADDRWLTPNKSSPVGRASVRWRATGAETLEVRVDGPTGPVFAQSGPSGAATTGDWVHDGLALYLQNSSPGVRPGPTATMAKVSFKVSWEH